MKPKVIQWMFTLLLLTPTVQAQSVWDADHLSQVKQSLGEPHYAAAYQALKAEADRLLDAPPLSVMMKEKTPASGDKHDYMSQARYYWPDPSRPDGLPYISRDGVSNPELEKLDRNRLGATAGRVITLSLAWYFSGEEAYARKATELIRVWFFDKATRMNPHLEYAQMIPGHNHDKGRCYGLIDTYSFVEMLDAVALLESSRSFTARDSRQLKKWFARLTDWMLNSPQGKEEAAGANNHSVAYDAQIVAFSLYTGNRKQAQAVIDALPEKRIYPQIEPDGRQPQELRRTLAFHYSQYNLTHFIDILLMAKKLDSNVGQAASPDGRSIYKAMDFLASYTGKPLAEWPYRQISGWDDSQQNFCKDLYRTAVYLNDEKEMKPDTRAQRYLNLYRTHCIRNPKDRFNLLYVRGSDF